MLSLPSCTYLIGHCLLFLWNKCLGVELLFLRIKVSNISVFNKCSQTAFQRDCTLCTFLSVMYEYLFDNNPASSMYCSSFYFLYFTFFKLPLFSRFQSWPEMNHWGFLLSQVFSGHAHDLARVCNLLVLECVQFFRIFFQFLPRLLFDSPETTALGSCDIISLMSWKWKAFCPSQLMSVSNEIATTPWE